MVELRIAQGLNENNELFVLVYVLKNLDGTNRYFAENKSLGVLAELDETKFILL